MKGYVVCVWEKIDNEEKLKEYALKDNGFKCILLKLFLVSNFFPHTNEIKYQNSHL